jgi:sterol desaturase/sphingolipid hydroxylase (fatty acid hydroxylase superfamily)
MLGITDTFAINDVSTWSIQFGITYFALILVGYEILARIVPFLFANRVDSIPVIGKHLDNLESLDKTFIFTNKCITAVFVYHGIQIVYGTSSIKWKHEELSFYNTILALVGFYLFYDFFYMWFHRILHLRSLYSLIHKHHHRQKAPSRGNLDAINVHPFEFFVGEYLHLVTIYFVPCHVYTAIFFVLIGGILATLNHTRFDVNVPGVYSVKLHDLHHRVPDTNYGQYTLYWDKLFGSFRAYGANDEKNK